MNTATCYNFSRGEELCPLENHKKQYLEEGTPDALQRLARFAIDSGADLKYPALVFVATRAEAAHGASILHTILEHKVITHIHGGCSKDAREQALNQLRLGSLDVCVCTDVWSAGIDIPGLLSVVLAYSGSAPIGLLQRIGRGSRVTEEKRSFTVYDLGCRNTEHGGKRLAYYTSEGYTVRQGGSKRCNPEGYATARVREDSDLHRLRSLRVWPEQISDAAQGSDAEQLTQNTGDAFATPWESLYIVFMIIALIVAIARARC